MRLHERREDWKEVSRLLLLTFIEFYGALPELGHPAKYFTCLLQVLIVTACIKIRHSVRVEVKVVTRTESWDHPQAVPTFASPPQGCCFK